MLVEFSLGAEMWRKTSVEISDALIYITVPLLLILITLISPPTESIGAVKMGMVEVGAGSC